MEQHRRVDADRLSAGFTVSLGQDDNAIAGNHDGCRFPGGRIPVIKPAFEFLQALCSDLRLLERSVAQHRRGASFDRPGCDLHGRCGVQSHKLSLKPYVTACILHLPLTVSHPAVLRTCLHRRRQGNRAFFRATPVAHRAVNLGTPPVEVRLALDRGNQPLGQESQILVAFDAATGHRSAKHGAIGSRRFAVSVITSGPVSRLHFFEVLVEPARWDRWIVDHRGDQFRVFPDQVGKPLPLSEDESTFRQEILLAEVLPERGDVIVFRFHVRVIPP